MGHDGLDILLGFSQEKQTNIYYVDVRDSERKQTQCTTIKYAAETN